MKLASLKDCSGWIVSIAARPAAPTIWLEHVSELGDRDRGRQLAVGELVAARVGDDEVVAGRHHRVEQQLAVLGAAVEVADRSRH